MNCPNPIEYNAKTCAEFLAKKFKKKYAKDPVLTDRDKTKSLSTNKLILIAPCAILSSRKNNGGKHGNDKAENMGNNG